MLARDDALGSAVIMKVVVGSIVVRVGAVTQEVTGLNFADALACSSASSERDCFIHQHHDCTLQDYLDYGLQISIMGTAETDGMPML
jgi:hypothetical protein